MAAHPHRCIAYAAKSVSNATSTSAASRFVIMSGGRSRCTPADLATRSTQGHQQGLRTALSHQTREYSSDRNPSGNGARPLAVGIEVSERCCAPSHLRTQQCGSRGGSLRRPDASSRDALTSLTVSLPLCGCLMRVDVAVESLTPSCPRCEVGRYRCGRCVGCDRCACARQPRS